MAKLVFPPASFFRMPLGILGLGLAWRAATRLWIVAPAISETIVAIGGALLVALVAFYAAKWLFATQDAAAELEHP